MDRPGASILSLEEFNGINGEIRRSMKPAGRGLGALAVGAILFSPLS